MHAVLSILERFTRPSTAAQIERAAKRLAATIGEGAYVKCEFLVSHRRGKAEWYASAARFYADAACQTIGGVHIASDPLAALAALSDEVEAILAQPAAEHHEEEAA